MARDRRAGALVPSPRPLRALFLANDGASVGHVTRAVAIARALRGAPSAGGPAGGEVQVLLATTSANDVLLRWAGLATVRLPAVGAGGLPEGARRPLVERALRGVVEGFAPDVLVVDTFPSGPHLELAALLDAVPRRVLVARTVRPDREHDAVIRAGRDRYDLVLVPDDPLRSAACISSHADTKCSARTVTVPPVTLRGSPLGRGEARARVRELLGRPEPAGPWVLAACGGRGDGASRAVGVAVRGACAGSGWPEPVVVDGLLDVDGLVDVDGLALPFPLSDVLAAFDCAVLSAGYNSAHECAAAGVPAVLYGRERAYDDQAARAERFEAAGLAVHLRGAVDAVGGAPGVAPGAAHDAAIEAEPGVLDRALPAALARALALRFTPLPCDGAAAAATAIRALCGAT